jgi:putative ABC transport system permease protein
MTPPRLATALIRRAVPADRAGDSVAADLGDEFDERWRLRGKRAARLWYWRQALSIWWWSAWAHPPDSHHQPRGGPLFDVIGDVRHGVRTALKTPGQTALIIATLAIAIGTTTVGFSFADTIILRGLPIAEPADTVIVYAIDARQPDRRVGMYFDDYLDLRERVQTVEQLSAWAQSRVTVVRGGSTYATTVSRAAGDLFGAWGLRLALGRGLRQGDDAPGAARVAVLAHHYWDQMFARAPSVIGETILLDGVPHEIVGVLDPSIEFGTFANIGIWASLPLERAGARDARSVMVTGRLAGQATVAAASAEIDGISRAIARQHPDTNRGRGTLVLAANRAMGGPNFWIVMTLLIAAVALVMTIAAANVAGVLLARAAARQREFTLRVALGARRARVFRQLAIEGLLLAAVAAIGGLMTAEAGLRVIRAVEAEPIFQQIVVDWHEVAFVALLAVTTPLLFSLAPAIAALRTDLASLLNSGGPRSGGSGGRARQVLVVAQLALAVLLVTVGGLVLRTASAMAMAPMGFDPAGLAIFSLALDEHAYADAATRRQLVRALASRAQLTGEVAMGALDSWPGVSVEAASPIEIDGAAIVEGEPTTWAHIVAIDADALSVLGIPLLRGRPILAADVESDAPVAWVSAEAATRYFGSLDQALGRRLRIRVRGVGREHQIVGITGDARNVEPERGLPPRVWVPLADPRHVAFIVRAIGDPALLSSAMRQAVRDVAPGVPIEGLETYNQAIARRGASDRVIMGMLTSFAAVALVFAATGLYGIVAFSASRRRAEFGTRVALGAQWRDVAGLVIGQAFKLLAVGLSLGSVCGMAVASAMRSMLYGVTPFDPFNLLGVVALLSLVTLFASLMPAWRAARVDVMESLRT